MRVRDSKWVLLLKLKTILVCDVVPDKMLIGNNFSLT
jgi:hypothetical protein